MLSTIGPARLTSFVRRYEAAQLTASMTGTAWRQGAKNALICGIGVALGWAALAAFFATVLRQSVAQSLRMAFAVVWAVTFLIFLTTLLYSRLRRGRILLDCGPHPTRWLFVLNFFLFILAGTGGVFTSIADGVSVMRLAFAVSFGVFWLIIAFGRLQVTERGIWQYWGLLPWSKIGSYRWADDSTLLITPKRRFLLRGALPVPPEHKQAVDDFLAQFCGGRL
jgi:hypothetical protein